jgi:hypothetical protein
MLASAISSTAELNPDQKQQAPKERRPAFQVQVLLRNAHAVAFGGGTSTSLTSWSFEFQKRSDHNG